MRKAEQERELRRRERLEKEGKVRVGTWLHSPAAPALPPSPALPTLATLLSAGPILFPLSQDIRTVMEMRATELRARNQQLEAAAAKMSGLETLVGGQKKKTDKMVREHPSNLPGTFLERSWPDPRCGMFTGPRAERVAGPRLQGGDGAARATVAQPDEADRTEREPDRATADGAPCSEPRRHSPRHTHTRPDTHCCVASC